VISSALQGCPYISRILTNTTIEPRWDTLGSGCTKEPQTHFQIGKVVETQSFVLEVRVEASDKRIKFLRDCSNQENKQM